MTSTSRRDSTSSWNSSNFSTPQNREKKYIARSEVRSPNKNHHHVWLVCKTRAKIILCHPETSLTSPRLLLLRRSGRSEDNMETRVFLRCCKKNHLYHYFGND